MKRALSFLLVAVLALGLTVTGFAKDETKIKDFAANAVLAVDGGNDLGDIMPEHEITIPLTGDMFITDKDVSLGASKVTEKIWRDSKMSVRVAVSSGSKAIDSYEFDDTDKDKDSVIKVKFVEELVSTSDLEFEFSVYVVIDGKRKNDQAAEITGTMKNQSIEVYGEDDYVDLSEGAIAEAQDYVKNIEVDLGEGVSIHTKLFKGKKYYGTAARDVEEADDAILSKYPEIDNVVTLKTIGLNGTGNIVAFDSDFGGYYVYDKDMNYLGEAKEMLPYSTKYYLSSKKLDIVVEEEATEEEATEEEAPETENPATGGNDAPVNVNDNPGTGR